MRFKDRTDAGRQLADSLLHYANRPDVLVLALPRGGLPVAFEVAKALGAPLDVFVVRKLGVPGHPELAMGAIAGSTQVLSEDLIRDLRIPRALVDQVAARERAEMARRERLFRGQRAEPVIQGRVVILVDDGLATGSTMEAAVAALRTAHPARVIVAVPVGSREACDRLRRLADELVCPSTPEPFTAVGLWYEQFDQTTDQEVKDLLKAAAEPARSAPRVTRAPDPADPVDPADPADKLRRRVHVLKGDPSQYDELIKGIGDARIVLLGEATHGTHEFYRERAFITRRLIVEQGFSAVAVEADWPDAYRVNRYVRGLADDRDAVEALADFERFPAWMWRNADVLDFVGWMREWNDGQRVDRRAGFYGLDLYSMRASMQAVLRYLLKVDPDGAIRARERYACFDRFGDEPQHYGYATERGMAASCEKEAVEQLLDLHRRRVEYASRDGRVARDEFFFAEQNARLVASAEAYYRTMFRGRNESWNLRDRHMTDTLDALLTFLETTRPGARVVVWAHNSHLGDARATEMGERGELNVGQLVRQRHGGNAILVGFTTHDGTVTAATEWDGPAHRRHVRPSLKGSYERMFHDLGIARFLLPLRTDRQLAALVSPARLERAIGVIYVPETERRSHYFHTRLADQFDYVLHFDHTRAVEPLERTAAWEAGEVAETFPTGL